MSGREGGVYSGSYLEFGSFAGEAAFLGFFVEFGGHFGRPPSFAKPLYDNGYFATSSGDTNLIRYSHRLRRLGRRTA